MIGVDAEIVTTIAYFWSSTFLIQEAGRRIQTRSIVATRYTYTSLCKISVPEIGILPISIGLTISLRRALIYRFIYCGRCQTRHLATSIRYGILHKFLSIQQINPLRYFLYAVV